VIFFGTMFVRHVSRSQASGRNLAQNRTACVSLVLTESGIEAVMNASNKRYECRRVASTISHGVMRLRHTGAIRHWRMRLENMSVSRRSGHVCTVAFKALRPVILADIAFFRANYPAPSSRVDRFERLMAPGERPVWRARAKIKAWSTNVPCRSANGHSRCLAK
jgi:hypothetical protein